MEDKNRRNYFRIDTTIDLDYRFLEADQLDHSLAESKQHRVFDQQKESESYQIQLVLRKIESRLPELNQVIKVIMNRVEQLESRVHALDGGRYSVDGSQVIAEYKADRSMQQISVNLSASGVAWHQKERLSLSQALAITLYLGGEELPLATHAKVVHCDREAQDNYRIGIEFIFASDYYQERLVQYIMECHNRILRQKSGLDE